MSNTVIIAKVHDQTVQLLNLPPLASGSRDVLQIRCEFDSVWAGYGKTAVFYREETKNKVYHRAVADGLATIPYDVLAEEGYFYFGIFGTAENTRTTEVVRLHVRQGALTEATAEIQGPAPDIYSQIMTVYGRMEARFGELVAMRGSGITEFIFEGDCFQGTIYSNGAAAFISFEFHDLPLTANNSRTDLCIPPEYAPLGLVVLKSLANSQDAHATISPRSWTGTERAQLEITAGNEDITDAVEFEGYYNLESIFVAELADLRVDVDGVTHATAGDAIRIQTKNIMRRVSNLEQSGGTGDNANSWDVIDKLCPSFRESGAAVRCEPLEGSPLKVTTAFPSTDDGISKITLTQCGRNLFDYTQYPLTNIMISRNGGLEATASTFSAFKKYLPVSQLRGQTITLNHPPAELTASTNACLAFYDENKNFLSGDSGHTHVVPDNAAYLRFSVPRKYADGTQIQLELGESVTAFEPYREPTVTEATLPEPLHGGTYQWSDILGEAGTNTIWSDVGTTTVEGKADPVAMINNLSDQVAALSKTINTLLEG